MTLYQIQEQVRERAAETMRTHSEWPCSAGCDECCRHLAAVPRISREEWLGIAAALEALPRELADSLRSGIRASANAVRPVTCPLLDTASGMCLVYDARPILCRSFGFYAEREKVHGCGRIAAIDADSPDVVWGNHLALAQELRALGPEAALYEWLALV